MLVDMRLPLIGITVDFQDDRYTAKCTIARMVALAGGMPILLPCLSEFAAQYAQACDGIILSGGDDPVMEHWGITTHEKVKPISAQRQGFELALLSALDSENSKPVFGICLGMQLMGLHNGGNLDQFLPETLDSAYLHWGNKDHPIAGSMGEGIVHSHHRQALVEPGKLSIVAKSPDGVIEAIQNIDREFYLGVQWHPERTNDENLGPGLFKQFIHACREATLCKQA